MSDRYIQSLPITGELDGKTVRWLGTGSLGGVDIDGDSNEIGPLVLPLLASTLPRGDMALVRHRVFVEVVYTTGTSKLKGSGFWVRL